MTDDLSVLEKKIGYIFTDPALLHQALTHSSTINLHEDRADSNERLEFLGDRVLGLVVANMLYNRFRHEEEGALSRRLTALVRKEALARIAKRIDLASHVTLSQGEEDSGGRENPALLADSCEALIAALYIDGGLETASRFIEENWRDLLDEDPTPPKDAKTALQEWTQSRDLGLPEYKTIDQSGPSHAPTFTVSVSVKGYTDQSASGRSKRRAEQDAAADMLSHIAGLDMDTGPESEEPS